MVLPQIYCHNNESSLFLGQHGPRHFRHGRPRDGRRNKISSFDEFIKVDTRLDAHAMQHVNHVLGWNVAGGSSGIGAASEAGDTWVNNRYSKLGAIA